MLDSYFAGTTGDEGAITIQGLGEGHGAQDNLGIPFIEAANMDDLAFCHGFVNASDRLCQTVSPSSSRRGFEMAGRAADIGVLCAQST